MLTTKANSPMRSFALALLLLAGSGCSYQYVDADGNRHIIGLARVTVTNPDADDTHAEKVTVETAGISVFNLASHGGLSIGYAKNSSTTIPLATPGQPSRQQEGQP